MSATTKANGTVQVSPEILSSIAQEPPTTQVDLSVMPLAQQLIQLRELAGIRMHGTVGRVAVEELATFSDFAANETSQSVLYQQIILDGVRGKIDEHAQANLEAMRDQFSDAIAAIHYATMDQTVGRVDDFAPPPSAVTAWDVFLAWILNRRAR